MFITKVAFCDLRHAIFFIIFSFNYFITDFTIAAPAAKRADSLPVPPAELFQFLRKFGYLERAPSDSESLYSEEAIIDAIKNLQKYGGLKETGELTNETLQLLISPRCGVPDIVHEKSSRAKRFIIGGQPWKKRSINYHIANWSPKVGSEEKMKSDMRQAFEAWAPFARLKFYETNASLADIIIYFGSGYHGDRYPFDGQGNVLAHAFYPYEEYGGDIHFDSDENWKDGAQTLTEGVDFLSVAVHELGHSLGLAHSSNPAAVMFPYYRGGTTGHSLEYDDIMGMYQLYLQDYRVDDIEITTTALQTTSAVVLTTQSSASTRSSDKTTTEKIKRRRKTTTEVIQATTFDVITNTEPTPTYEGDYVTVDKHKERFSTQFFTDTTPATVSTVESEIPNICEGFFDAIGLIRGEIHIFKGAYVWRLDNKLKIVSGYPAPWRDMFGLPATVQKIDAIYERTTDSAIVFFSGASYWVYDGEKLIENSPQPLTNYGIPRNIDHIDAAMVWAKNGKTYLFSGNLFWRFNETTKQPDRGYPLTMDRWYGIPANLDAAVTLENGKTYFFKANKYWLFNNYWVRPEKRYPRKASKTWLGCK